MADFSYLDKLQVGGKTARFILHGIPWEPAPVLIVRSSGDSNKIYQNAALRHVRPKQRQISAGTYDIEMLRDMRNNDRKLFPGNVVIGWKHIRDIDGNEVPFSTEECSKFLKALPNEMFDEVRNFCGNYNNFLGDIDVITTEEVADLAKN